jgi:hypothetical protein
MKKLFLILLGVCYYPIIWGQTDTLSKKQLPFHIDDSKKITEFDITDKKEGTFVTGLPRFEFDPIRGFGVGGNLNVFFNNTQADPFFDYTAYRHRLNAEFFIFQNGRIRYAINYDAPYIFNSKWRVRADLVHWEDPNAQYWGIGRASLEPLRFKDKKTGVIRDFNKVKDYEHNLAVAEKGADGVYYTDFHFHHMQQREQLYNLLGERVMMGGKLRLMFGYEALFTSFSSYNGLRAEEAFSADGDQVEAINNPTLVDLQKADGTWDRFRLAGFNQDGGYQFTSMLAGALIYDTRDFEPDPSKGMFWQYSHEYSSSLIGSEFNFNKFMIQGQVIHTLKRWNNHKNRITFAGLGALGHIFGSRINFIEMWDLSSQAEAGGIMVLGGERSIRGFREARFLAPTVALFNVELRARLLDFSLFKQHFNVGLTPFFDGGCVWDRPADIQLNNWRGAPGMGCRVAWNQSTILRLDFANSQEGSQFFFGFGNIF